MDAKDILEAQVFLEVLGKKPVIEIKESLPINKELAEIYIYKKLMEKL